MALTQLEMVLRGEQISELDSTQWHHQKSTEEHASGNRVGGPRLGGRNQDGHGMTKSEDFFFFENSGFRAHVVATTVCATGCVHTLRVARTFSLHFFLA